MIAALEAYRAGLFQRRHWLNNIGAGLVVGIVALPLAMAFAIASGVTPQQGLYTAIVAGVAVSLLGGSRVQIAGPTGAFIVILAGIAAEYGVAGLQTATFMAGIILVLFGVCRLGGILRFIPAPVITGFTAGIGIIIWVGQWKDFFGLPTAVQGHFHEKLWQLLQAFPQLDVATTLLAFVSLALVIATPRLRFVSRIPGPLVALIVATLAQSAFDFPTVTTLGKAFGEIPRGLPSLQWPDLSPDRIVELIGPAFAVAMLGAIESLLSAVVADGMIGTRHDSNQELVGQGLANIASPLFGGIAATGAIARTATSIRNGGTSPVAGVVHALVLVLVLLFLAPLAANIPLAALAAILFVVAWNMSQLGVVVRMVRESPRADVVILLVTLGLTVFADLVVAVNVGVALAMMHFLRRMAQSVEVRREDPAFLSIPALDRPVPDDVLIYSVEGPFFFAAVDAFHRAIDDTHADPRAVVIRLARVPFIDATGLQALGAVAGSLQDRGVRVVLVEANARVTGKLRHSGMLNRLGPDSLLPTLQDAIAAVES